MRNVPISWIMNDDYLAHYNHNHDALGRFASSVGSGVSSVGSSVKTTVSKITGGKIGSSKKVKKGQAPVAVTRKQKQDKAKATKIKQLKTARQRKETAEKVINSGNAKLVYENRDSLSTAQLNKAIERINTEARVVYLMQQQNPSKLKKISEKITPENVQKVSNLVEASTNLYNNVARIANITRAPDDKLPYVGKAQNEKKDITSATATDILKKPSNYTDKQISEALRRENNLRSLEAYKKAADIETPSSSTPISKIFNKNKSKKSKSRNVNIEMDVDNTDPNQKARQEFDKYFESEIAREQAKKKK